MQRIVIGGLAVAALAAVPARADACGVVTWGGGSWFGGKESKPEPVSMPEVIFGGGMSTDGIAGSVQAGWAVGDKHPDSFFPGTTLTRVLFGIRVPGPDHDGAVARTVDGGSVMTTPSKPTEMSLTYGWYDNSLFDAAFDIGVAGSRDRLGPTASLTLGYSGVDVRFTGGAGVGLGGGETRFVGAAELVLDVMAIARRK